MHAQRETHDKIRDSYDVIGIASSASATIFEGVAGVRLFVTQIVVSIWETQIKGADFYLTDGTTVFWRVHLNSTDGGVSFPIDFGDIGRNCGLGGELTAGLTDFGGGMTVSAVGYRTS